MISRALFLGVMLGTLLACVASPQGSGGAAWRVQAVDAATGQPLEGVVVLAYWMRYTASFGGWAGGEFVDAEEVVTGPDGRFVIQPRWTYTIPGVTKVTGPEIVIFKPGYGQWRVRSEKGEEAVIELPPLKTREERLKAYQNFPWWDSRVPVDRTKRMREALDAERAYLGLR